MFANIRLILILSGVLVLSACEMPSGRMNPASPAEALRPTTVAPAAVPAPDNSEQGDDAQPPIMVSALPDTFQNFEQIGHTALGSAGWHAGLALKDDCAYVGNHRGPITIVDIGDPAQLEPIGTISYGADGPASPLAEPVELRTLPELDLLVVSDLSGRTGLHTFDVTDCAQPQPLGALYFPMPVHEFYLWQGSDQVLFYGATFGGSEDLLVADLTDPAAPREITRWSARASGTPGQLHSLSVSPDGSRAYLALWTGGFAVANVALPEIAPLRETEAGTPVLWLHQTHSAVPLSDPRYVLLTAEIYGCPFGAVTIVDVSNPAVPQMVSQFSLPENRCEDLPDQEPVFSAHNPLVVGDLVFLSWYGGGLQALDVRDPLHPVRAGQFVPSGDGATLKSYVGRYPVQVWSYPILRDGFLYVVDIQSGLYVVRYTGPGAGTLDHIPRAEGNVTVTVQG